ncbi:N-acetylmuramoyl-L-alanine amidase family protein [Liquorilactobacillus nagelii]|uniref:N-acetylmuramoyl-L-alanine amidase family protein n=1 Tax=Liquorilactobacillus nagelii TaxID=82688 RepID=UPI001CCD04ED|nr:hypothetical protein [Liquorilactobacillus nagelii]ULQ49531.1 hypothetical protein J6864_00390 [Liquorilactobacillus nagelii]
MNFSGILLTVALVCFADGQTRVPRIFAATTSQSAQIQKNDVASTSNVDQLFRSSVSNSNLTESKQQSSSSASENSSSASSQNTSTSSKEADETTSTSQSEQNNSISSNSATTSSFSNSTGSSSNNIDQPTSKTPPTQTESAAKSMAETTSSINSSSTQAVQRTPTVAEKQQKESTKVLTNSNSSAKPFNNSSIVSTVNFSELIEPIKTPLNKINWTDKLRSAQANYLNQLREKGVIKRTKPFSTKNSQQELDAEIAWVHQLIQRQLQRVGQTNFWRATFSNILKDNDPLESPISTRINQYSSENFMNNYQRFTKLQAQQQRIELSEIMVRVTNQKNVKLLGFDEQQKLFNLENNLSVNGWQKINQKTRYYGTNGVSLKGWQKIDSTIYYFDPVTGELQTGIQSINQQRYFFDLHTGACQGGWQKLGTATIYANNHGQLQTGWQRIDGNRYFFSQQTGFMVTGFAEFKLEKATYFFDETGKQVFGPKMINQQEYLFDRKSGKMKTGLHYLTARNQVVFYDETGQMIYRKSSANFVEDSAIQTIPKI